MNNKDNTSTVPNSSQPTMAEPKKDNTLMIVLVVIGLIIGLPVIAIVFIFSMAFRFAGDVIGNINPDDWGSYSEDISVNQMNPGQRETVNNLWVLSTNSLITGASVSRKDCRNMGYVAEIGNGMWFDSTFCSGATIQVGAEVERLDDETIEKWLYVSDGTSCAEFNIDFDNGALNTYRFLKHTCRNVDMKTYALVDTSEADSPNAKDDFGASDEGSRIENEEDSSARQKSST